MKKEILDLQKILNEEVEGRVFVMMRGDVLLVRINTGKSTIKRKYNFEFKCVIVDEITNVRDLANRILYAYKHYLEKRRLKYENKIV